MEREGKAGSAIKIVSKVLTQEYGGMVPKGENQEKELPSEAVPPKEAAPFLSCP